MTPPTADVRARIEQLSSAYCHRFDDGDAEEWAALFTDDATLQIGRAVVDGRAAVLEWGISAMNPGSSRHFVTNLEIDITDDDASVTSDFVVLDSSLSPKAAGRYHDRVACCADGSWRFLHRRITFLRPV